MRSEASSTTENGNDILSEHSSSDSAADNCSTITPGSITQAGSFQACDTEASIGPAAGENSFTGSGTTDSSSDN